jgi:hypothetical protein
VQEISSNKRESDTYSKLKNSVKIALQEYDQDKKEETKVEFVEKIFPLNVASSSEIEIKFRVTLIKGKLLQNSNAWFYIPDGVEMIDPPEKVSWRQPSDYIFPNIRTVKIPLGNISIGPAIPRILKIRAPSNTGKFILRYTVRAEGYLGKQEEVTLFAV